MSEIKKKIVFIGAGNMAEALISGLIKSKTVSPAHITAVDIRTERLVFLKKKYHISVDADIVRAIAPAAVVFLAVKPQQMEAVLRSLAPAAKRSQVYISIAAGITTKYIEKFLPLKTAVIRSMPNTPALLGAGAVAVACGSAAGKSQVLMARKLFSSAGMVVELPESQINAVTALSGSGPAYVFLLAEALARAGAARGLPKLVAAALARQTIIGAGSMLAALDDEPAELRRRVTSPGGTTEAAIRSFEKNRFSSIVDAAVHSACTRAKELST